MFLTFALCNLFVLTIANPFHKYPFVFLLDVGNEELEKTNVEQIRISVPGGSIALRYPAVGEIDTITHVRVSSIDFGTDLKASILDGGPGARYVVLVLMGNPGVIYDAVLTIQTVINDETDSNAEKIDININDDSDDNNSNNSAENFEEGSEETKSSSQLYEEKNNAEAAQSTSNVYIYAQNEALNNDYYNEEKELEPINDIKNQYYSDSQEHISQINNYIENNKEEDELESPRIEIHSSESENNEDSHSSDEQSSFREFDRLSNDSDDLEEELQIESQDGTRGDYDNKSLDFEDPEEIEQKLNNEESHYDVDKYRDLNNNYYDTDDRFAVAS